MCTHDRQRRQCALRGSARAQASRARVCAHETLPRIPPVFPSSAASPHTHMHAGVCRVQGEVGACVHRGRRGPRSEKQH